MLSPFVIFNKANISCLSHKRKMTLVYSRYISTTSLNLAQQINNTIMNTSN